MLNALARYQEWGLCTFPLIYRSKKPAVKWEQFQKRKPTDEELRQWFSTNSTNVAIVCGAISDNFAVLDFDIEDLFFGFAVYWKESFGEAVTDMTPVVQTRPGHFQVYLKFKEIPPLFHPVGEQRGNIPDIQGEGGYIVAPPSIHPDTGKPYEFINDVENIYQVESLTSLYIEIPDRTAMRAETGVPGGQPIPRGSHDTWLFRRARSYRGAGDTEDLIFAKLQVDVQRLANINPAKPYMEHDLRRIAHSAASYTVNPSASITEDGSQVDKHIQLFIMSDIKPEAVDWLWNPYIPMRKVTLLEGDPGVGKSWVCLAIATAVSTGRGLPGGEPCEPRKVIIASAEDGLGDTIRPRLDNMGADVTRIIAIGGPLTLDDSGFILLEDYISEHNPALLIIDPIVAYMGAQVDIHRANETRQVLAHLSRVAEQHNTTILAVRHLSKGSTLKPIYRGIGSIDFTAACRSVLLAGCEPENPQNRVIVHIKSNLALAGPSVGYELREDGFYWTGESTLTADDVLSGSGESSALEDAMGFLLAELTGSSLPSKQVFRDAKDSGISEVTLRRAKYKLGVIAERIGGSGGSWYWRLPGEQGGGKDDQGGI